MASCIFCIKQNHIQGILILVKLFTHTSSELRALTPRHCSQGDGRCRNNHWQRQITWPGVSDHNLQKCSENQLMQKHTSSAPAGLNATCFFGVRKPTLVWTVSIFRHCFPEISTCCLVYFARAAVHFVDLHVLRKGHSLNASIQLRTALRPRHGLKRMHMQGCSAQWNRWHVTWGWTSCRQTCWYCKAWFEYVWVSGKTSGAPIAIKHAAWPRVSPSGWCFSTPIPTGFDRENPLRSLEARFAQN